jgi:hypothetical protein
VVVDAAAAEAEEEKRDARGEEERESDSDDDGGGHAGTLPRFRWECTGGRVPRIGWVGSGVCCGELLGV